MHFELTNSKCKMCGADDKKTTYPEDISYGLNLNRVLLLKLHWWFSTRKMQGTTLYFFHKQYLLLQWRTIDCAGKLRAHHFSSPSSRLVENNSSRGGASPFTAGGWLQCLLWVSLLNYQLKVATIFCGNFHNIWQRHNQLAPLLCWKYLLIALSHSIVF